MRSVSSRDGNQCHLNSNRVSQAFVYDPLISWRYLADNLSAQDERPLGITLAPLAIDSIAEEGPEAELERARSRARSLHIFRSIQDGANVDARIASVAGGNNAGVVASIAHSRRERSMRQRAIHSLLAGAKDSAHEDALNNKALALLRRVEDKLSGTDFGEPLEVADQVQRLLTQATSCENLCQLFIGWCAFW